MKIVRKSSTQATNSSNLDSSHESPMPVGRRLSSRQQAEESTACNFKSADFSHMSWHELHELSNCQTRSGQLSLEGSASLAWLRINVLTNRDDLMDSDKHEIVNFLELARKGKQDALSNGMPDVARQFELALDLMHGMQGQTIGVDALV